MASGRIFGIKKSFLLKFLAILFSLSFVAFVFVSIFVFKTPVLWFFGFCLFVGVFELAKSVLFKYDSCLYLGSLLSAVGVFGFIFVYTDTANFAPFYIALAFVIASVVSFSFTHQNFHLVIAFSIIFVSAYSLLLSKNLISTPIFVAFVLPFLVLLILEMVWLCFLKK